MKLRSKFLKWNAGLPVAMLNKETAIELGVKAQEMILIKTLSKHPKEMTAVLDIIDGEFGKKQILLSLEVKSKMNLKKGQIVDINIAPIPRSVDLIRKKLNNKRLSRKEIDEIIKDIVNDRLSEPEIALFVAAMYRSGMTNKETIYLINAILKTGERFSVKDKFVVDKHSIGALARKFLQLGRYFHKKMKVVLTDGSQPIGNGIGPALELMDIIKILDPKKKGPEDLEKKSLFFAGNLFEMTGKAKKGKGIEMAEKILYSGKAFEKFKEIVKAQEGNLNRIKYAKLKKDILSDKIGKVTEIDNKKINNLARVAGSPADKSAGIYLYHHVGDAIKKGEKIVTIYSETSSRIDEAFRFYKENKPITIK